MNAEPVFVSEFQVVPDGDYDVIVEKITKVDSRSDTNKMEKLVARVIGGEYDGGTVSGIASQKLLSALLKRPVDNKDNPVYPAEIIGQKVRARVQLREVNGGQFSNIVAFI